MDSLFAAEGAKRRSLPQADLDRVFFAERYVRVPDTSGYAVWRRWRVYGEEALAGREAALWLREQTLTVELGGETLSRYAVELVAGTGRPQAIGRPVLSGTAAPPAQPKLFALSALGAGGWLKALRLEDHAPRRPRPEALR